MWVLAGVIAVAIIGLLSWAAGGRDANDAEISTGWGRGPTDGGGTGGF